MLTSYLPSAAGHVIQLLPVFFQTCHGTEIVPLTIKPANNGILFGDIHSADRVAMGYDPP